MKRIAYKIRYRCKCGWTFKTKRAFPTCDHCGRHDRLESVNKRVAA